MTLHLFKRQCKRVFVAVAQILHLDNHTKHTAALELLPYWTDMRMSGHERCKPVRDIVEERITLHLRESAEVDIRTLLLHVVHAFHAFFHLFHTTLSLLRMKYILQRVFIHFHQSMLLHLKTAGIDDSRHYLFIYLLTVAFSINAIKYLHLQLCQLVTACFILTNLTYYLTHLRIEPTLAVVHHQRPTYKCALSQSDIRGLSINVCQHLELIEVKSIHSR